MQPLFINSNNIAKICVKNNISYLGVFGSAARGERRANSDIDLLVRFSKKKSLPDLIRVEREFKKTLGNDVDLVTEASISPYLKDRIKRTTKLVYEQKG